MQTETLPFGSAHKTDTHRQAVKDLTSLHKCLNDGYAYVIIMVEHLIVWASKFGDLKRLTDWNSLILAFDLTSKFPAS